LFSEEQEYKENRLQMFINKVSIYAKWREHYREEREEEKETQNNRDETLNNIKPNIRNQVKEV